MTKREHLKNGSRGKRALIDMEKVYRQLDSGRSVKDVAAEWGVSRTTLYRRHRDYQKEVELLEESEENSSGLPPLPDDLPELDVSED